MTKMTAQEKQYAREMARGTLLTHLYRLQELGLNDPAEPRTAARATIHGGLGATGMLPPPELECNSLQWLEGAGYVEVEWAMDDQTTYSSVTITQKGISLYEDRNAKKKEPGLRLQPRR